MKRFIIIALLGATLCSCENRIEIEGRKAIIRKKLGTEDVDYISGYSYIARLKDGSIVEVESFHEDGEIRDSEQRIVFTAKP